MSLLRNKSFWVGASALGALGLWFLLTTVDEQDGDFGDDRAAQKKRVPEQEQGDVAAQEQEKVIVPLDVSALETGESVEEAPMIEPSVETVDDESWNPGGENEPTVEDVQHWTWLKDDLNRLIDGTRPKARKRLDAEEFEKEYLTASLEYLKLDEEERERFETAVQAALTAIDDAREKMQEARAATQYDEESPDSIQVWKDTQADFLARQKEVANGIVGSIPVRRRTTLMREQALAWIVRCDFGIQHANRDPRR